MTREDLLGESKAFAVLFRAQIGKDATVYVEDGQPEQEMQEGALISQAREDHVHDQRAKDGMLAHQELECCH